MRAKVHWLVSALVAATFFNFAAMGPARAGLLQCFEVLSPDKAIEATQIAAKAGACGTAATGDPLMALTIAAVTSGAIAGAYSTSKSCKQRINGVVGVLVAEALLASPLTNKLMSETHKNWLRSFIAGNKALSLDEILNQIPGLAIVNAYIDCGCNVAGLPGDLKKIADKYASSAKSCANFASDAINTIGNAFAKGGEAIHEALHGPSLVAGIQMEADCPVYRVPFGYWKKGSISTRSGCGATVCVDGGKVLERLNDQGETQSTCVPSCPKVLKKASGQCWTTYSYDTRDGRCVAEAETECPCLDGQAASEWGRCSPACKSGVEVYDKTENHCVSCPIGMNPIYESSNNSIGSCQQCPIGHYYNRTSLSCVCPAGQITRKFSVNGIIYSYCDEDSCGMSCESDGQKQVCTPLNAVRNASGDCVGCPAGTHVHRGRCEKPLDLHVRFGGSATAAFPPPDCPSGQNWDGERCVVTRAPATSAPRRPPPGQMAPRQPRPGPVPPAPVARQPIDPGLVNPPRIFPGFLNPGAGTPQLPAPIRPAPRPFVPPAVMVPQAQPQFQMQQMQPQFNQAPQFQQMVPR